MFQFNNYLNIMITGEALFFHFRFQDMTQLLIHF
jgi:hypothetical protein